MKNQHLSKILPVVFGFFIMGFCDVVGISTMHVKSDFGLSDTMSNMIPVALFSMFLLFSIPTGMLMDKIGRKKTVLLSYLITIVAMFIPLISYNFTSILIAFALLGVANTIIQVALNPLLTNVVDSSKLTSVLTAGQFVKAISSFCGPFIAAFAASMLGNWQYIFPIYAVISIISALWLAATSIEENEIVVSRNSIVDTFSILKNKTILLSFLGIVAVVGIDVGINTCASKLLIERASLDANTAGYGSSMYFAFRTLGAFAGAFILSKFSSVKFFKISISIALVAITLLLFAPDKLSIFILLGIIGFSISNIFSIIMGLAIQAVPEKTNQISALLVTGISGGALIPIFMGMLTDWMQSQNGSVLVLLFCATFLLITSFRFK